MTTRFLPRLAVAVVITAVLAGCVGQAIVHEHQEKVAATTAENKKILSRVQQQCEDRLATTKVDPIRNKVAVLSRPSDPMPVDLLIIGDMPTAAEKVALLVWAKILDECGKEAIEYYREGAQLPSDLSPELRTEIREGMAHVMSAAIQGRNMLIAALYTGPMTYGEYNRKRAELNEKTVAAVAQWNAVLSAKERQEVVGRAVAAQQQLNAFVAVAAAVGCAEARGRAANALCQ